MCGGLSTLFELVVSVVYEPRCAKYDVDPSSCCSLISCGYCPCGHWWEIMTEGKNLRLARVWFYLDCRARRKSGGCKDEPKTNVVQLQTAIVVLPDRHANFTCSSQTFHRRKKRERKKNHIVVKKKCHGIDARGTTSPPMNLTVGFLLSACSLPSVVLLPQPTGIDRYTVEPWISLVFFLSSF